MTFTAVPGKGFKQSRCLAKSARYEFWIAQPPSDRCADKCMSALGEKTHRLVAHLHQFLGSPAWEGRYRPVTCATEIYLKSATPCVTAAKFREKRPAQTQGSLSRAAMNLLLRDLENHSDPGCPGRGRSEQISVGVQYQVAVRIRPVPRGREIVKRMIRVRPGSRD